MEVKPVEVVVQAGELTVSKDEIIGPNKLRMLADAGWSISSAWNKPGDGFVMLLQRQIDDFGEESRNIEFIIHKGTANCPATCDCEVQYAN